MSLRHVRVLALAWAGLPLGLALACFRPPSDDVMFACDPVGDPSCPPGYACELDGCCHREGSDVEASWGACALGSMQTGTDTGGSGTDSETSGSETDTSGSETDTGGSETDTTSG